MVNALADTFQLLIIAELVRPLALCKLFANYGKILEAVFAQEETINCHRMILGCRENSVHSADGKFVG